MKRKRFTVERTVAILEEHHVGHSSADLRRKHGISSVTCFK